MNGRPDDPSSSEISWGPPSDSPTGDEPPRGPTGPGNDEKPSEYLGRYRVIQILGKGGFGRVYEAFDEELRRKVAIKVPNRKFKVGEDDGFLVEAQVLARLEHPNIVPIYDVVREGDGRLLIVSKFIEGSNLAQVLARGRMPFGETATLVMTVASALHHVHLKGIFHRDIKPANILIDPANRPCVVDFGLALREEDFGKGPTVAGTIPYMSPEQARSEGHRVDGRSDVFSLGIVLYEMLTRRRPFHGATAGELIDQIIEADPRPPRQIDDAIPKELERVCLKALAKAANQRYATAKDLAEDLSLFLHSVQTTSAVAAAPSGSAMPVGAPGSVQPADSGSKTVAVVPKGLRSFEANDADFFPELLPGPRDRHGLWDPLESTCRHASLSIL